MEVCIFGVLTVNLLTFPSQTLLSHQNALFPRCLLKKTG